MKGRKKAIYLGAVVLSLLVLVPPMSVLGTEQDSINNTVPIRYATSTPMYEPLTISETHTAITSNNVQNSRPLGTDVQVTTTPEEDIEPAIGAVPTKELLIAYTHVIDVSTNDVIWDYSTDEGQTWTGGLYYLIDGAESHPAIDYWGTGKKLCGTMACDPIANNGADQHTFKCTDPTDTNTYEMSTITWGSSFPYSNRRIPDIAGYDGNGLAHWYGVIAVVGTRGSPGSIDMPIFNYADFTSPTQGWSSYFAAYSGCENAAIEIDQTNGKYYAVFDNYNATAGDWDLLLFRGLAKNDGTGHIVHYAQAYMGGTENTKYPAVDVNEDKVIIVAQTDEGGTQDIVCYYSDDAGVNWDKSFVASGSNDEKYPKIVSYGDTATCTFIMNDDLYYSYTEDGGATWSTPEAINDQAGSVDSEYRNADITYGGTVVWTDMRNTNADVYLDIVTAGTPKFPVLSLGSFAAAGIGKVSITVKNTGDANATNVNVTLTVTGGILGRINKTVAQTIALAVGQEVTVTTTGMIFGLGAISLAATASCAEATPPTVTKSGTAKVLIVFIRGL